MGERPPKPNSLKKSRLLKAIMKDTALGNEFFLVRKIGQSRQGVDSPGSLDAGAPGLSMVGQLQV